MIEHELDIVFRIIKVVAAIHSTCWQQSMQIVTDVTYKRLYRPATATCVSLYTLYGVAGGARSDMPCLINEYVMLCYVINLECYPEKQQLKLQML